MSIDTHITQLVCSYFDILRQIRCIRRSLYNVHRITAFILSKADLTIVMSHCRACWIVTLSEYSRSSMLLLVLRLELVNTTMSRRPILVACTWTHNLQVVSSFIHVKLFYRIVSYKCLHGTAPSYLQDVIQPVAVTSRRRLRSTSSSALVVPASRRTIRSETEFSPSRDLVHGWNSLPQFVTDCTSSGSFRKYLKTYHYH